MRRVGRSRHWPGTLAAALDAVAIVALSWAAPAAAQQGSTDWTSQNLNLDNNRFAQLDEIDTTNVGRLVERWSYEVGPGHNIAQATPLVVGGVMYLHSRSTLFALDAATGEELWTAVLDAGSESGSPVRGPTFADGNIYAYRGADLYAMDAGTGAPVESFGNQGVLPVVSTALQMKYPDDYPPNLDPVSIGYRITTPPAHHDGTMYVAAALSEGHIPGGLVIATSADTGAIKWVFNTIPQGPQDEGWEIARDTWGSGARAGGGIWTQPAVDPDLGMVYVNAGNPSPDYDGSARVGINLFSNSTIALDLDTGALRWYYQAVHHDLWDWDHVTGPVLFDVTGNNGETIKGVAAAGKNCLFYMWDRETGKPLHAMVETLVPTETDVPGEQVWPTQPIPHNAAGVPMTPLCATFVELDDPELASRSSQFYSPYWISKAVIVPHGGSSFGSPSFSPSTGLVYVTGKNGAIALVVNPVGDTLEPGPDSRGHTDSFSDLDRISEDYPPSVSVSAYDPVTGEQTWQAVLPARSSIGASGNMVTAGNLVFQGVEDGGFYALDAGTGEELFRFDAPRPIRASPMTYQVNGTQHVTVVATNRVVTLALP
ncbi:MAG: PQQ-binding-like beta-propeller repeat protein [Vicinamibacterales bacterium]|jgi:quinoprotein glucose dehydrogenase|nr:PQQ-binding-like beta-propeller repeat protein [Vicinamibacterales bacterium]